MTALLKRTRPPFPSGWSSIAIAPSNLTLANTLPVGQSFLWHRHQLEDAAEVTEEFSRAVDNPPRVVCLRQSPTHIYYASIQAVQETPQSLQTSDVTRIWLEDYFQLARYPDLSKLYSVWIDRDPVLFGKTELNAEAVGVRVLRQDPLECLIAFITSTNNHITRITSLLQKLCQTFSPPLLSLDNPDGLGETTYHLFPKAGMFPEKSLEVVLRELGFGYRAGFISSTLASLRSLGDVESELERWRAAPLEETRQRLLELKGVGRKVADCVQLMCMDQLSLVPIDTHLHTIAMRHPQFPSRLRNKRMSTALYDDVQSFLAQCWGPCAGWAQAVMFAKAVQSRPLVKRPPTVEAEAEKPSTPSSAGRGLKRSNDDAVEPKRARRAAARKARRDS